MNEVTPMYIDKGRRWLSISAEQNVQYFHVLEKCVFPVSPLMQHPTFI